MHRARTEKENWQIVSVNYETIFIIGQIVDDMIVRRTNKRHKKKTFFFSFATKKIGSNFRFFFFVLGFVFCSKKKINFYHGTRIKSSDSLISDIPNYTFYLAANRARFSLTFGSRGIRPKCILYKKNSKEKKRRKFI